MYCKGTYKKTTDLKKRQEKSKDILEKNKNCIPIICELERKSQLILDKNKFIVPNSIQLSHFIGGLRKRISNLRPDQSIFTMINDKIMSMIDTLDIIYAQEKDEDGFLYIVLYEESTFG